MVVVGLDSCGGGETVVEVCMLVVEKGVVCMVGAVVGWGGVWAASVGSCGREEVDGCGQMWVGMHASHLTTFYA